MTNPFSEKLRAEARLIILRTLAGETDGRLNSSLLQQALITYGITRPREWVHGELAWLAMMGAVIVTEAGTVQVATLTTKGQSHIDRESVIPGVKPPSRPEA